MSSFQKKNKDRPESALTDQDYRMLARSWISQELADAAGIKRVSSFEGGQIIGRNGSGNYAGLIFPYVWPGETNARDFRLRRDSPELEHKSDGTTKERQKYLGAPGRSNLLYFPCGVDPSFLNDCRIPVIVVEGEKKALALRNLASWNSSEPRFLPVGLSGIWNWRGTVGKEPGPNGEIRTVRGPIPDLGRISWKKRKAVIIFDSDAKRNHAVYRAQRALVSELERRGAEAFLVNLPDLPDLEKTGADDFLAHPEGGPERMLLLIDNALRAQPGVASEILNRAGILGLTDQSGIDEVESTLRRLRHEMAGADSLREAAVRTEAIKYLMNIGIQAPAQLVGAALARQDQNEEKHIIAFSEPEPWAHQVDGASLLDEIANVLCRFIILPANEIKAIALWILHTYAIGATSICPILVIKSAEKRCGKTLLLELLLNLVFRPLPASNITAASLFRAIEKYKPTLLLDEADTFLHNNDELKGIINSGYRSSSSYVVRAVGDDFEPKVFNTFGPKAIAQINTPQETIMDRGIIIEMRRKKPDEQSERLRSDRIFENLKHLRQKAMRWAKDNLASLTEWEPQVPTTLNDRAQDSWRPLLAIADLAGKRWAEYGRECAIKLSGENSEASKRALLLSDIKAIFEKAQAKRIASAEICAKLGDIEEHPWPEWRNGLPITVRQLARLLEPLGIRPKQLRMGEANIRGYELDDFTDVFSRYLPNLTSATQLQPAPDDGSSDL
jgi:putative DNA primase/helicase